MRSATLAHPFCNPAQHCSDHREKPPLLVSFNPFDGKKMDRKFDACWLLFAPVKSFLTKKSLPLKTIPHSLTLPAFCADAAANFGAPNAALPFDDGQASERPWAGEFDDFIPHASRYHASFVRSTDGCRTGVVPLGCLTMPAESIRSRAVRPPAIVSNSAANRPSRTRSSTKFCPHSPPEKPSMQTRSR